VTALAGSPPAEVAALLERTFREQSGRILATLVSLLGGDLDRAEEALQEAAAAALEQWPQSGAPANPRAWLVSTARFKTIDRLRRERRFEAKRPQLAAESAEAVEPELPASLAEEGHWPDERLKLLFTCCHPALAVEAQIALALRTLSGLSTEEIARAFLVPVATLQQRVVRAKAKIRDAGIPYRVPPPELLDERVEAVAHTLYLIFNEGYAASSGAALVRADLCREAIALARMLSALLPGRSEVVGLLALMQLADARRPARLDAAGELVRLEDQDRSLWNPRARREGLALTEEALRLAAGRPGPFALQAAIAGVHARAECAADTNWREIAGLYRLLARVAPSPVVELNRAVALAEAFGAEVGLAHLERIDAAALPGYAPLPIARGELLARLGRIEEAMGELARARALAGNETERRHLERRLAALAAELTESR
jgi:RNA polymerase sigma-70 factor (ECF subfamily)